MMQSSEIQASAKVELVHKLVEGKVDNVYFFKDGSVQPNHKFSGTILSGSFNPLHEGHLQLAQISQSITKTPVVFEITVSPADKMALDRSELLRRLAQFETLYDVVITRATRFIDKSRMFPNSTFVVGLDTAVRILMPKYYNNSAEEMEAALSEMTQTNGCSFLVAGRKIGDKFETLDDIADQIPPRLARFFRPIEGFRVDISSTEIRAKQHAAKMML